MRTLKAFLIGAILLNSWNALASGEVKISIKLWPAGDFVAHTKRIKGGPFKTGADSWVAKNVLLDLKSLKTGLELRDKHMIEKYFEVNEKDYGVAVLVQAKGEGGKFTGKLKLHGKTSNVSGTYQIKGLMVLAKFKTKLSQFHIKKAEYMNVGVEDEVNVEVNIAFTDKKPTKKTRRKKRR